MTKQKISLCFPVERVPYPVICLANKITVAFLYHAFQRALIEYGQWIEHYFFLIFGISLILVVNAFDRCSWRSFHFLLNSCVPKRTTSLPNEPFTASSVCISRWSFFRSTASNNPICTFEAGCRSSTITPVFI